MVRRTSTPRAVLRILAFALSFVLTALALPHLELRGEGYPKRLRIPYHDVPGDDAFFVAMNREELSQLALYHGLGDSISNARRADLLLVGNSRLQTGLREEVVVPAAEELGVRAFNLGCGHDERVRFALDVIRRHDLRPKVVVVCGGPDLYREGRSLLGQRVVETDPWDARKEWFEGLASWEIQRHLHVVLPRLDYLDQRLRSHWIVYRSAETGWWRPVREPARRRPVAAAEERHTYRSALPVATELARELEARGALLVLTAVPSSETITGHLRYLGEELGVPWIEPPLATPQGGDLFTTDGLHLARDSAEVVATAFWEAFVALEPVRERLLGDGSRR